MPATTLVLAATVLATAGQPGTQDRTTPGDTPPSRVSPFGLGQDAQEAERFGPRPTCRMPVVRGDANVDSHFVVTPDALSTDRVRYSMRRAPSTHMQCPDAQHRRCRTGAVVTPSTTTASTLTNCTKHWPTRVLSPSATRSRSRSPIRPAAVRPLKTLNHNHIRRRPRRRSRRAPAPRRRKYSAPGH